jgi:hypothetical protein
MVATLTYQRGALSTLQLMVQRPSEEDQGIARFLAHQVVMIRSRAGQTPAHATVKVVDCESAKRVAAANPLKQGKTL